MTPQGRIVFTSGSEGNGSYDSQGFNADMTTSTGNQEDAYAYLTEEVGYATNKYGDGAWDINISVTTGTELENGTTLKLGESDVELTLASHVGSVYEYSASADNFTITDDATIQFGNLPSNSAVTVYIQRVMAVCTINLTDVSETPYTPILPYLSTPNVTVYNITSYEAYSANTITGTYNHETISNGTDTGFKNTVTITNVTGDAIGSVSYYATDADETTGSLIVLNKAVEILYTPLGEDIMTTTTTVPYTPIVADVAAFSTSDITTGLVIESHTNITGREQLVTDNDAVASLTAGDIDVVNITTKGTVGEDDVIYNITKGFDADYRYGDAEWYVNVTLNNSDTSVTTSGITIDINGTEATTSEMAYVGSVASLANQTITDSSAIKLGNVPTGTTVQIYVGRTVSSASVTITDESQATSTMLTGVSSNAYNLTDLTVGSSDAVITGTVDSASAPAHVEITSATGTVNNNSTYYPYGAIRGTIPHGFGSYPTANITSNMDNVLTYIDYDNSNTPVEVNMTAGTPVEIPNPMFYLETVREGEIITYDAVPTE